MRDVSSIRARRAAAGRCRRGVEAALCLLLAAQLAGCGTLLYPERHGHRDGRVDPTVLLLDGALLVLFVVPGLVAFGVDFHTGAIYLPAGSKKAHSSDGDQDREAQAGQPGPRVVHVSRDELTADGIAEVLRRETGLVLDLADPRVRIHALRSGPDRASARAALERSLASPGSPGI